MKREFVLCKFALLCVVLVVLASCNKDAIPDPKPDDDQAPRLIQKVNNFIFDVMDEVYLWTALMPRNIDVKYERDPKEYFMKLLYKDEDRWSYITDDYDSFIEGGDGVETTFGYSLAWGRFTGTDYFFGVIRFVYPDTPAARAGLKRGDIIYKANGNY
ncbi:MAG: hypothetical protein LBC84_02955, partial [Prevotellaceae bacterium]|nr:hypothetical protein [Prevotellaceae bacterium]